MKSNKQPKIAEQQNLFDLTDSKVEADSILAKEEQASFNPHIEAAPDSIYDKVLPVITSTLKNPVSIDELAVLLDVNKTQLGTWLKRAVEEKTVRKLSRPVRYVRFKKESG